MKKLKKWLQVRDELLTSDEILRVWKGLHYCFWMSDKPLVQEELAESISSFVHCFKVSKQKTFNLTELFLNIISRAFFHEIFALFLLYFHTGGRFQCFQIYRSWNDHRGSGMDWDR